MKHLNNKRYQLKKLREASGMTQQELSEMSGVNRVSIARYETTGANMTTKNAEKLADALQCTTDELLGRTQEKGA